MFVRVASFHLQPDRAAEARRIYAEQGVPRVRAQPGNVDCYLLEPLAEGEPHLACTLWRDEDSARAYETSGLAQEVAGLIRPAFDGAPQLRTYRARRPGDAP